MDGHRRVGTVTGVWGQVWGGLGRSLTVRTLACAVLTATHSVGRGS